MKYITGEVGDLNDWNMAEGFYNNLVAKAASSAISKTIKNQDLPISVTFNGSDLDLEILFSTDETEKNAVVFRDSIYDTADFSLGLHTDKESRERTLKALKTAVAMYEEAIKSM